MIIKEIELVNFRNIGEFREEFNGGVYLITGENEVGKTTLLNAIVMLLTGDRSSNLLKQGEKKGHAKAKIGEYEVEISFTEKNPRGTISIKAPDGMKSDNKSMLQQIFDYSDFDAHEFVGWSQTADGRRKQVEMVKGLLPKEVQKRLQKIDEEVPSLKEQRKELNSSLKVINAMLDSFKVNSSDIQEFSEPVDIEKLYDKKAEAMLKNQKISDVKERHEKRAEEITGFEAGTNHLMETYDSQINELKDKIKKLENDRKVESNRRNEEFENLKKLQSDAESWLKENEPVSVSVLQKEIDEAESGNEKRRQVKSYLDAKKSHDNLVKKIEKFNDKIELLATEKETLISDSKLPVEGLTFTEDGLLLNGIPFETGEISTSQGMEVSAKLIIAKNPKSKVFRISQGESLGEDKLKEIIQFAEKNGYQGFIENVVRGQVELRVENYTIKE